MEKLPIDRLIRPVNKIILEYTSGIVLFMGVVFAIAWGNSHWASSCHHIWEIKFSLRVDQYVLSHPLRLWINDGLMAIFLCFSARSLVEDPAMLKLIPRQMP